MSLLRRLRHPGTFNVLLYALANALAAVLTLVLTRVLWSTLSPLDFGVWALIDPMLQPAASLVLFGIEHAVFKQLNSDGIALRDIMGGLMVSTLPATALSLTIAGLVARFVFNLAWADALLLTMLGEALYLLMQTAFRAAGAAYSFAALLLSRNLLYLAVLLVAKAADAPAALSIDLVFLVRGVCVILVAVVAVGVLRPLPQMHWVRYRDALVYGFPLLVATFIFALSDMTDRWFLAEFTGVVAVGVYALYLKVAAILSQAIVIPFGLWFAAERFRRLDEADGGRQFFIQTAVVLTLVCGYLSGGVWLSRDTLLPLIAPGVAVSPLVLALCLGAVICLALSQALNVGLLLPGHTGKNAVCNTLAVVASAAGCLVLVPFLGMDGAATGRLLGGLALLGVTAAWSNRVFEVAFPFAAMLLYFTAAAAAAAALDALGGGRGLLALTLVLFGWTLVTALASVAFWSRVGRSPRTQIGENQRRFHTR